MDAWLVPHRYNLSLNEEKPLPYFFDVVHDETLNNVPLIEHIDRIGIMIFETVCQFAWRSLKLPQ
jgi:hypothetical protein